MKKSKLGSLELPDICAPSRPIAACEDWKYIFIGFIRHVDVSSKVHHETSPEEKEKNINVQFLGMVFIRYESNKF